MAFLGLIAVLLSMVVQFVLKSKFKKFAGVRLQSNLMGRDIAQMMLRDHGIFDVQVISVEGQLTDHYNPADKTVNLSHDVFYGANAASAAVAAHEVGHAVQHATAYTWLNMRSRLVPAVSAVSRFMPFILLGGVLMLSITPALLIIGVALFAVTTLFSFVTLPVEFDASHRALVWLRQKNITTSSELALSREALTWAAMTYVLSALASLAYLIHYLGILRSRD